MYENEKEFFLKKRVKHFYKWQETSKKFSSPNLTENIILVKVEILVSLWYKPSRYLPAQS